MRKKSLRQKVYDGIIDKIARRELAPGEALVAGDIAQEFRVSRTPVTEALRALEAQGLIQGRANHVYRVVKYTLEDVWRLYEVREGLEMVAARSMAERGDQAQIDGLRRVYSELEASARDKDIALATQHDFQFHQYILFNCDNSYIVRMMNANMLLVMTKLALARIEHERAIRNNSIIWIASAHKPIIEAIEARDADAAEAAVRDHIRNILDEIRSSKNIHGPVFSEQSHPVKEK